MRYLVRIPIFARAAAIAACLALASSSLASPPRPDLADFTRWVQAAPDPVLVNYWMLRDCAVGEKSVLITELRARGTRLEQAFLQAFNSDRPDLPQREAEAREQYALIHKRLAEGSTFGLDAADLARLQQESVDDYVGRALEQARRAWRGASIAALGQVGGKTALDFLTQRDWSQDPDRELIERTIMQIRKRV